MRTLRAAALCGLALVLTAAPARAGTVTAGLSLGYAAAPGEQNRLSVTRGGDRIVFTETGGLPVGESAAACDSVSPSVVTCAATPAPAAVDVALGDGDDQLAFGSLGGGIPASASGGDGADRLDAAAATGFTALDGGAGDDTLRAGAAESDLTGGPGADTLTGGPEDAVAHFLMGAAPDGPDRLIGGAGLDVAGYSLRSRAAAAERRRRRRRRRGRRGRRRRPGGRAARGRGRRRRADRRRPARRGADRRAGRGRADRRQRRRPAVGRRRGRPALRRPRRRRRRAERPGRGARRRPPIPARGPAAPRTRARTASAAARAST